jgi:hypothetical protein
MSRNIEPIVHDLMNRTKSADFLNKVDMNLINPYKDMEIVPQAKKNSENKKITENESSDVFKKKDLFQEIKDFKIPSEFYDDLNMEKFLNKKSQKNKSKIYSKIPLIPEINESQPDTKIHDMNVLNNLDNIQQIVKNETLHDLSEIKDPIVEIPGFHPHPHHLKKKKNLRFPNFIELNGNKSFEALKNSFGFNFRQKSRTNSIFDK